MTEQQQREYGAAVLSAINEKEIYYRDVVHGLGITRDYLNRIINGDTVPGPTTEKRIGAMLGVSVSSFEK